MSSRATVKDLAEAVAYRLDLEKEEVADVLVEQWTAKAWNRAAPCNVCGVEYSRRDFFFRRFETPVRVNGKDLHLSPTCYSCDIGYWPTVWEEVGYATPPENNKWEQYDEEDATTTYIQHPAQLTTKYLGSLPDGTTPSEAFKAPRYYIKKAQDFTTQMEEVVTVEDIRRAVDEHSLVCNYTGKSKGAKPCDKYIAQVRAITSVDKAKDEISWAIVPCCKSHGHSMGLRSRKNLQKYKWGKEAA